MLSARARGRKKAEKKVRLRLRLRLSRGAHGGLAVSLHIPLLHMVSRLIRFVSLCRTTLVT